MIGIILLVVTWLLLRLQGHRLSAIGLDHPRRRIAEFAIGFLVLSAAVAVQQLLAVLVTGDGYRHNPGFSAAALAEGARFVVNSVARKGVGPKRGQRTFPFESRTKRGQVHLPFPSPFALFR